MEPIRVLLAEDEATIAEDIRTHLEELGYQVSGIVTRGEEAVEVAGRDHPDLVLMDIQLSGEMDGIQAARRIRENYDIPVIYLTSYADRETLERAKLTAPFGYLLKPIHGDGMRSAIEMALYKHGMERRLGESERRFRLFYEEAPIAYLALDVEGRILAVNRAFLEMSGFSRDEVLTRPLQTWMAPSDRPRFHKEFQVFVSRGEIHGLEFGFFFKGSKRRLIRFDGRAGVDPHTGSRLLHGILHDITEQRSAEEALQMSERRLRDYSIHLQTLLEKERTAIAREIHDELGQALTALKMDLSWLKNRIGSDLEGVLRKIDGMTALIDQTLGRVKRISSELRPGLLDDLGLGAAIEWQAEEFEARTGIPCQVSLVPPDLTLDEGRSTAVFRILQEALTNVYRHARASRVTIDVTLDEVALTMTVHDDGRGITPEDIHHPQSFGLIGIRERVDAYGGTLSIVGKKGEGTTLTIRIPRGEGSDDSHPGRR